MPPNLSIVVVSFFIFGFFQNLSMSLLFAFEADAVEYGEYKTGKRTEGATYAIYSFFRKVSQAVAGAVAGYALALGGFVARAPEQSDPPCARSADWSVWAQRSSHSSVP